MGYDLFHEQPQIKDMQKKKQKKMIMVPYPAQGHVTPMLKLATSLSTLGFQPLIILPEFIHRRIISKMDSTRDGIMCVSIPDGLDESSSTTPCDFFAIEKAMENHMPDHLDRLIGNLYGEDALLIVDLLASWAIDVGRKCGVAVAGFWPAMTATFSLISAIPDLLRKGIISDTGLPKRDESILFQPNQPHLSVEEMPWLIGTQSSKKARFKFWTRTMERSKSLKWILLNSFPNEPLVLRSMKLDPNINYIDGPICYPIGPLGFSGLSESPTFWDQDTSCLDWLDRQKPNSVIYISFGSWVSPIGEDKVRALARALEDLGRPFIWLLGPSWRDGLPNGYVERIARHGKIVTWGPQVDVLQHKAVGCFLTHCGWNSIVEAIHCKKPLLCFPVAGDQFLNCEYIVNVWKIGIRINGFDVKNMDDGVRKVMDGKEMKCRIDKLSVKIMEFETITKDNMLSFLNDVKRSTYELQLN